MIQIQAIGNLGKDAEQKTIGGNSYISFSIGVTEKIKGEARTIWLRVMKLDKEGKLTAYLTKGTKVWVSGHPSLSAYTNKGGDAIPDLTVWADKLEFYSSADKQNKQFGQQAQQDQRAGMDSFSPYQQQKDDDDQLPF